MSIRLRLLRAVGWVERRLAPGIGACARCTRPWTRVKPRLIKLRAHSGAFFACTDCFPKMTYSEMIVAVEMLAASWGPEEADTIAALRLRILVPFGLVDTAASRTDVSYSGLLRER